MFTTLNQAMYKKIIGQPSYKTKKAIQAFIILNMQRSQRCTDADCIQAAITHC